MDTGAIFVSLTILAIVVILFLYRAGMFNITVENSTLPSTPWKDGKPYWSSFELFPDWKGSQYFAFKGSAYYGKRYWTRTSVVVKAMRGENAMESHWRPYMETSEVTRKMAVIFNKKLESQGSNGKVIFMKPAQAAMDSISDVMALTRVFMGFDKHFTQGENVVIEENLEGDFNKFITDVGEPRVNGTGILEAFCHFTYDQSGGEMVVCNLKGIFDGQTYSLTSPIIHSRQCKYGSRDKGAEGIANFFKRHTCTGICVGFSNPYRASDSGVRPSAPLAPPPYQISEQTVAKETKFANQFDPVVVHAQSLPVTAPPPYEKTTEKTTTVS